MDLAGRPVRFAREPAFARDLAERVDAHFAATGRKRRGDPRMIRKALVVVAWLAASYAWAVFLASSWWEGVLAIVSLALASAAVPMCLSHDGCHGAFSDDRRINAAAAWAAGFLGICHPWWVAKHNVLHHGYTRQPGLDDDLDQGVLFRMHPAQPRRAVHRFQHVYAYLLYPFLHVALAVTGLRFLATGRVGVHAFRRPSGSYLAKCLGSAAASALIWIVVPGLVREPWLVVSYGLLWSGIVGMVLVLIFQVEHCVGEVATVPLDAETGVVGADWARSQVIATQDFATGNRLLTWYCGALNFHVEHHLFPKVSHVHYPELAPIVAETCARHGVPYRVVPTFRQALSAHRRWLRRLGTEDAPAEVPPIAAVEAPASEHAREAEDGESRRNVA